MYLQNYFEKHVRRHNGETNVYKCNYANCNKSFATTTSFRYHEESHSEARPYLCHECSKAFKSKRHLIQHFKTHKTSDSTSSETETEIQVAKPRRGRKPAAKIKIAPPNRQKKKIRATKQTK